MAQILFDLGIIAEKLGSDHRVAKGAIRQLFGAHAIKNDLSEAATNLILFWDWHLEHVLPLRSEYGDNNTNAAIGKALFSLTTIQLTRALDMGADGRARIDMRPSIRSQGLEGALDDLLEFRNQELAHYGGFANNRGKWTNDRVLLSVDGNSTSTINVWTRWNSQYMLALKLDSLIEATLIIIHDYIEKKTELLLNKIRDDESLRRLIQANMPANLFFPENFFNFAVPPLHPSGPVFEVEWELAAPT